VPIGRAVVVGGGLIGIEMVEMLRSRGIDVTFLVRESAYMDYLFCARESELIHEEIRDHGVDLRLGCEVDRFLDDGQGCVRAVRTNEGEEIPCAWVGLAVGVSPNTDLARSSGVDTDRGILVDRGFETSIPDVFAIGDCAQFREPLSDGRRIEQLWYSGRMHGREMGLMLCGRQKEYSEPMFHNAAKFFGVEYQTYGRVPADDSESISWGDGRRYVRVSVDAASRNVLGVNAFGVRLRHVEVNRQIRKGVSAGTFLESWDALCFDPEFARSVAPPSGVVPEVV